MNRPKKVKCVARYIKFPISLSNEIRRRADKALVSFDWMVNHMAVEGIKKIRADEALMPVAITSYAGEPFDVLLSPKLASRCINEVKAIGPD